MNPDVIIIDYGIGNILSVSRAFQHCNASTQLVSDPEQIINAGRLVLPGVGAFANAMEELKRRQLDEAILHFEQKGNPLLGICLGMQIMLDSSEEFGKHKGLGLIPGEVVAIPACSPTGQCHKIPHTGWNELKHPKRHNRSWNNTLLKGISENDSGYFVHSFHAKPKYDQHLLAVCEYDNLELAAVLKKDNVYGCQFHPEKSAHVGLSILSEFMLL